MSNRPFSAYTRSKYLAHLKRRGFVVVGSGYFSTVLAKPGSARVVKVGSGDVSDGWIAWALYTRAHPAPWVPRIECLRWHGEGVDRFYVATMPRLVATLTNVCDRPGEFGLTWRRVAELNELHAAARSALYGRAVAEVLEDYRSAAKEGPQPFGAGDDVEGLVAYMADFARVIDDAWGADLHKGNAMVDAGGRLYVTDPLSFSTTESARVAKRLGADACKGRAA